MQKVETWLRPRGETSFRYPAITPELLKMNAELEALGGGDARVGEVTVYCRVCPSLLCGVTESESIVNQAQGHLAVRDPHCPPDVPAAQSARRFKVHGVLPADSSQGSVFDCGLGREPVDWFLQGFNSTILAFGQTGTGKTHTLFGPGGPNVPEYEQGLVTRVFKAIFTKLQAAQRNNYQLGLSYWELRHNEVVDLLDTRGADPAGGEHGGEFAMVEVHSLEDVETVLQAAHDRSVNWATPSGPGGGGGGGGGADGRLLPGRAHAMLRLTMISGSERQLTQLHIADLVGAQSLAGGGGGRAAGAGAPGRAGHSGVHAHDRERREVNKQLLSFSKVVSELTQRGGHAGAGGPAAAGMLQVVAARDSKLTQMVTPLLAGNNRTTMLVTVSPAAADYLDTCNSLRIATRAQSIATACSRTLNVAPQDYHFTPLWRVVSVRRAQAAEADEAARGPGSASRVAHLRDRIFMPGDPRYATPSRPAPGPGPGPPPARAPPSAGDERAAAEERAGAAHAAPGPYDDILRDPAYNLRDPPAYHSAHTPAHKPAYNPAMPSTARRQHHDENLPPQSASAARAERTPHGLSDQLTRLKGEFREMYKSMMRPGPHDGGPEAPSPGAPAAAPQGPAGFHDGGLAEPVDDTMEERADAGMRREERWEAPEEEEEEAPSMNEIRLTAQLETAQEELQQMQQELSSARAELSETKTAHEAVLSMLHSERKHKDTLSSKLNETSAEMLERCTQYEVELEGMKAEAVHLRSKCRQLESESTFAGVFDKYEKQIAALEEDGRRLAEENAGLARKLQRAGEAAAAGAGLPLPDPEHPEWALAAAEKGESQRVAALRAQVKKLAKENEGLQREIADAARRDRNFDLHRRNAEEGLRKVNELKKEIAAKEAELLQRNLALAKVEGQATRTAAEFARVEAARDAAVAEAEDLRHLAGDLRQQIHLLNTNKKIESLSARLPQVPSQQIGTGLKGRRAKATVLELAQKLQREVNQTSKTEAMFNKLVKEISDGMEERRTMVEREAILLNMLADPPGVDTESNSGAARISKKRPLQG